MAVVGITPQDAVDNFAVLAALAGKAAEMATARITQAELAELVELAGAIGGSDDVVIANRRFHRALNLTARSPRLFTYLRQAVRVVPGNFFELFPEQEERSTWSTRPCSRPWRAVTHRRPVPSPRPTCSRRARRWGRLEMQAAHHRVPRLPDAALGGSLSSACRASCRYWPAAPAR